MCDFVQFVEQTAQSIVDRLQILKRISALESILWSIDAHLETDGLGNKIAKPLEKATTGLLRTIDDDLKENAFKNEIEQVVRDMGYEIPRKVS